MNFQKICEACPACIRWQTRTNPGCAASSHPNPVLVDGSPHTLAMHPPGTSPRAINTPRSSTPFSAFVHVQPSTNNLSLCLTTRVDPVLHPSQARKPVRPRSAVCSTRIAICSVSEAATDSLPLSPSDRASQGESSGAAVHCCVPGALLIISVVPGSTRAGKDPFTALIPQEGTSGAPCRSSVVFKYAVVLLDESENEATCQSAETLASRGVRASCSL